MDILILLLALFVLSLFLGVELIVKVPPTLHTPLMSGTNAVSGITLVGALLAAGSDTSPMLVNVLGFLAVTDTDKVTTVIIDKENHTAWMN